MVPLATKSGRPSEPLLPHSSASRATPGAGPREERSRYRARHCWGIRAGVSRAQGGGGRLARSHSMCCVFGSVQDSAIFPALRLVPLQVLATPASQPCTLTRPEGSAPGCKHRSRKLVPTQLSSPSSCLPPKSVCRSLLRASVQFSRSVVSDSLRTHESQHARPPCPSPTPRVYPNSCSSSFCQWCHPTISSSIVPFSCPQSFPASGYFPMSQLFA